MDIEQIKSMKAPFDVVGKDGKRHTIIGFAQNDPLGVGGGIFPDMPVAYFQGGGWLLVSDVLRHYEIAVEQSTNPLLPENTEKKLHVFENEVPESVIAYDVEDAIKVWEETIGEKYDIEESGGEFFQVSDDIQYTLYEEETINPEPIPEGAVLISSSEFSHTYKATCRAWADARGRCYLGSIEY